ncbi:MAG: choice-of-anchor Q domain-containing protein, partial [bacterium]
RDGIAIYGGFDGTEAQRTERDVPANPAILTGEIKNAGASDNTFHVVTSDGNDSTAVLDGFTVTSGNASGAPVPHGGGMISISSSPTIRNVIFADNAGISGGGLYADGGAPILQDVVFGGNNATTLGGAAALSSVMDARLYNVSFEANTASSGGGLYLQVGSAVLVNTVFSDNLAINYGGGIYASTAGALTITNGTFSGNTATYGGGIANNNSDPIVTNTILWDNANAEIYNTAGAFPVVSYSLVDGSGGSGAGWDSLLGIDGGNNLDEDPLFTDPPNHNLRLSAGSPAVDAGDNEAPYLPQTDRDGGPRVIRGVVDMGAYEDDAGVGIGAHDTPMPALGPEVRSIWPNPFNPLLMVDIELDRERPLRVDVYDVRGGHVRCLQNGMQREGPCRLTWDGTDGHGRRVASGVYLLRFVSEEWRAHRKVVLLK